MANKVYANDREIACKAGAGKTICAFPDVCFTPPENPATPPGVPVPYPNTGFASDTTEGSKTVMISDKEIMLKNNSYFKTSTGDEAGCAAKKGVITSKNIGKVYFNAWSMDVKFEGENVDRHLDLTTNNHACFPGDTPTWPFVDTMSASDPNHPCVEDQIKEMEACKDYEPYGDKDPCESIQEPPSSPPKPPGITDSQWEKSQVRIEYLEDRQLFYQEAAYDSASNQCLRARRCMLVPYKPTGKQKGCCDNKKQTGHHLIEASAFFDTGRGGDGSTALKDCGSYDEGSAPSICAEGTDHGTGTHGLLHTFQSDTALNCPEGVLTDINGKNVIPMDKNGKQLPKDRVTNYKDARDKAAEAVSEVFPESGCDPNCIKAQLDNYHINECKMNDDTQVRAVATTKQPDMNRLAKLVSDKQPLPKK